MNRKLMDRYVIPCIFIIGLFIFLYPLKDDIKSSESHKKSIKVDETIKKLCSDELYYQEFTFINDAQINLTNQFAMIEAQQKRFQDNELMKKTKNKMFLTYIAFFLLFTLVVLIYLLRFWKRKDK